MKTVRLMLIVCLALVISSSFAQSKTTESLQKDFPDVSSLFFYKNTLRMFNQKEDKTLDELIDNIDKMKLLMIKKPQGFTTAQYKKIITDYKSDKFEEGMTSRYDGKKFDILLKGKDKDIQGMLVLVDDSEMLYVLDIVGFIALDKVSGLFNMLEESSDFAEKLQEFKKGNSKEDDHKH